MLLVSVLLPLFTQLLLIALLSITIAIAIATTTTTTKNTSFGVVVHGLSTNNYNNNNNVVVVTPDRRLVVEGMDAFRNGDIQGSIKKFDSSVLSSFGRTNDDDDDGDDATKVKAYLWQRGISYYYADKFENGSRQFRDDVLQSPLDVEEIVWDAACLMRLEQQQQHHHQQQRNKNSDATTVTNNFKVTVPPPNMLSLPPGKKDRRPIMSTVLKLFEGKATEHELANVGHASGNPADDFYSKFYLGLYAESVGEDLKAEGYMKSAAMSQYARAVGSRDYMVDCARVHCKLRHWL